LHEAKKFKGLINRVKKFFPELKTLLSETHPTFSGKRGVFVCALFYGGMRPSQSDGGADALKKGREGKGAHWKFS